jgi:oxygen-independent coproporphyrinogen-3 oxidase
MLGLRLAEGLSLEALTEQFGQETLQRVWACLQPYRHQGWIEIGSERFPGEFNTEIAPTRGQLRLTDPEGFLFSNVILVALFEELE